MTDADAIAERIFLSCICRREAGIGSALDASGEQGAAGAGRVVGMCVSRARGERTPIMTDLIDATFSSSISSGSACVQQATSEFSEQRSQRQQPEEGSGRRPWACLGWEFAEGDVEGDAVALRRRGRDCSVRSVRLRDSFDRPVWECLLGAERSAENSVSFALQKHWCHVHASCE